MECQRRLRSKSLSRCSSPVYLRKGWPHPASVGHCGIEWFPHLFTVRMQLRASQPPKNRRSISRFIRAKAGPKPSRDMSERPIRNGAPRGSKKKTKQIIPGQQEAGRGSLVPEFPVDVRHSQIRYPKSCKFWQVRNIGLRFVPSLVRR